MAALLPGSHRRGGPRCLAGTYRPPRLRRLFLAAGNCREVRGRRLGDLLARARQGLPRRASGRLLRLAALGLHSPHHHDHPKPVVVVAIAGRVVIAVGGEQIAAIVVVERGTPQHPECGCAAASAVGLAAIGCRPAANLPPAWPMPAHRGGSACPSWHAGMRRADSPRWRGFPGCRGV